MKSNRTSLWTTVTLAGFAASLVLTGCGSQAGTAASPEPRQVTDVSDLAAPLSVVPAAAARPAVQANAAERALTAPASPSKHAPQALKSFTFPDGHISFQYPASWTVRTVQPPAGLPGIEVIVTDGAGNDLLSFANGVTAGCAAGPVTRHVLDQAAVPGMTAPDGTEPVFGFAVEAIGDVNAYYMGLVDPRSLAQGEGIASWCSLVQTGNGGLFSRVLFDEPAFKNQGAARAWMNTDQYAQLRALLLSLDYA